MPMRKEESKKQLYFQVNKKVLFFYFVLVGIILLCIFHLKNNDIKVDQGNSGLAWEWVIEPGEYEAMFFVDSDWIAVEQKNGKYSVINAQGEVALPDEYEQIGKFYDGIACVKMNGECFYIDKSGGRITNINFDAGRGFHEGLAAVKVNDLWGYIDCNGTIVIPPQYDEVKEFSEGLAAIKVNGLWGYIDCNGTVVISPQYDEVEAFSEGLAAVMKNEKWGFINVDGRAKIELKYDEVGNFSEGKATVKVNNCKNSMDKWAYMNKEGEIVINFYSYEASEGRMVYVGEFHDGLALVTKEIYCLIDTEGKTVLRDSKFFLTCSRYNKEYDAIPGYIYTDDFMTVRKYGLVGLNGELRLEPVFDYVSGIYNDYVLVSMYSDDGELEDGIIRLISNRY